MPARQRHLAGAVITLAVQLAAAALTVFRLLSGAHAPHPRQLPHCTRVTVHPPCPFPDPRADRRHAGDPVRTWVQYQREGG